MQGQPLPLREAKSASCARAEQMLVGHTGERTKVVVDEAAATDGVHGDVAWMRVGMEKAKPQLRSARAEPQRPVIRW